VELEKRNEVISIENEMKNAYLDYAMSVIVGRALPDFRDGLKPVHRRVFYSMHELNNYHDKPYKKSARVVGDVIGKYHPHGDTAVYETIVRMAQYFSMRYTLVDGQGNFGSVDGDSPAAMRYTEVRLSKTSKEFLSDLDKDTVDFAPNYDETLKEPVLLPTKLPNYLVNGSSGIAVGMSTNVPPHNLTEVTNALIATINNPEITTNELLEIVPGPDFPTSGIIYGRGGIVSAYNTGRGIIKIRARANIEETKKGNERIIIVELPYQVNKASLIEKIAELVKEKKIEGISDLKDESSKKGIRVVVDIKKNFQANVILNQLYKHTSMQTSFGIIMLGLENNQPKVVTLKEYLNIFISFRREVTIRRLSFLLKKAEARAHILLGLKVAVENIDEVVRLIKKSSSPVEAKQSLITSFDLSQLQSQAILELKLQRLTALERDKILKEYNNLLEEIKEIKRILESEDEIIKIVKDELIEINEKFGDQRKTEIVASTEDLSEEDFIKEEDIVVTTTISGYIKRMSLESFRAQRRGGKGVKGQTLKDDDVVNDVFVVSTHDYIFCFSDQGKCYWLKTYRIPHAERGGSKGKHIVNLINIDNGEKIVAILPVKEFLENINIVMVSKKGIIKKTSLMNFSKPKKNGIIAVKTDEGDFIKTVKICEENQHVMISTKNGKSICFKEKDITKVGRTARGVKGISLSSDDSVVGAEVLPNVTNADFSVMTVFEKGYGKRTLVNEFRVQKRGGKGISSGKTTDKVGKIASVFKVFEGDGLMLISNKGQTIRTDIEQVRIMGRMTQGVRLMNLSKEEKLVAVTRIPNQENV
jgi:DNA gyrase subunit A